jgi:hypothetical protein
MDCGNRSNTKTHIQVELGIASALLQGLLEAGDGGLSHEALAEVHDVWGEVVAGKHRVAGTHVEKLQQLEYLEY